MAVYKVPQDVEADDKLIGPFSFRQFIYLIIVAGAAFIGWMLFQVFAPLVIIVLPVIVLFGALALPLRKDQPMETYLAAIISFYLKPRRRLWSPDGAQALVEVTVPPVIEVQRTKDISQDEAEQRLSYLAQIVDSRGWAVRGVQGNGPVVTNSMTNDAFFDAQKAPDILDESVGVARDLESRLQQTDTQRHQAMLEQFRAQSANAATPTPQTAPVAVATQPSAVPPIPDPYTVVPSPATVEQPEPTNITFNPYPSMRQSVISPVSEPVAPPKPTPPKPNTESPSLKPLSPDIINLANNPDLSVETIAREANRIHEKEKLSDDEVVISLR